MCSEIEIKSQFVGITNYILSSLTRMGNWEQYKVTNIWEQTLHIIGVWVIFISISYVIFDNNILSDVKKQYFEFLMWACVSKWINNMFVHGHLNRHQADSLFLYFIASHSEMH